MIPDFLDSTVISFKRGFNRSVGLSGGIMARGGVCVVKATSSFNCGVAFQVLGRLYLLLVKISRASLSASRFNEVVISSKKPLTFSHLGAEKGVTQVS